MVAWNSYLPHGNGDNAEDTCRLTQCLLRVLLLTLYTPGSGSYMCIHIHRSRYVTHYPSEHKGGEDVPINGE